MKGTWAKRNVCRGSCVSTGAKFPVAPVESAPMLRPCVHSKSDACSVVCSCDGRQTDVAWTQTRCLYMQQKTRFSQVYFAINWPALCSLHVGEVR